MTIPTLLTLALAGLLPTDGPTTPAAAPGADPSNASATVSTLVEALPGGTGGLEVDAQGRIYSSDFGSMLGPGSTGGDRVFRIDPKDGSFEVFATGLRGASGNGFDPEGRFLQSNIGTSSVSRIDAEGRVSTVTSTGLLQPVGILADAEGTLFVANCGSGSIAEITPDGQTQEFASSPLLQCPNGIAIDEEHMLYVANFSNGDVIKVDWAGEASRLATLPGKGNGHLVYREGFLYVVARNAHQIYRVSLEGEVELFAGSGERGHRDGPALEASFCFPNDLAFSPDGKFLYVNENQVVEGDGKTLAPTTVRRIALGS